MQRDEKIRFVQRNIEHCVSVIALCRAGGQSKAEASYETRLAELNAELAALQSEPVIPK